MGLVSAYFPGVRCVHIIKVPGAYSVCVCVRVQISLLWGGMRTAGTQRRPFVPLCSEKCVLSWQSVFKLIFEIGLFSRVLLKMTVKLSTTGKRKKKKDSFSVDVFRVFISPVQFP